MNKSYSEKDDFIFKFYIISPSKIIPGVPKIPKSVFQNIFFQ